MNKFEIIDHTADVGITATGDTLEELFENAALGMFHVIGGVDGVKPAGTREVRLAADDVESLLAAFLAELLYMLDAEHFVTHHADVRHISDREVRADVHGEPLSPRHRLDTEIKAVTHHDLEVRKGRDGWHATVLFDV